ncbi:phage tail tube protein [Paenibacillus humicus]|uniref:phage tail tube protein n=1 Tax=Paenibacillus humicus TaxID=412861 RepID=UPI000FD8C56C|nr:phage tail tube protein [Paenibacillus humicus]
MAEAYSGNHGKLFDADGNWLTNVFQVEVNIDVDIEEIKRAGSRWKGHKVTGLKGTGSYTSYLLTTNFKDKLLKVTNDTSAPFVTELIVKLADPEASGAYRVRVKNVMFDKIPVIKFAVGEVVEEEHSFVFSEVELLDRIVV